MIRVVLLQPRQQASRTAPSLVLLLQVPLAESQAALPLLLQVASLARLPQRRGSRFCLVTWPR